MLLNRDYVGHMASQVIKKLVEDSRVEIKEKDLEAVIARARLRKAALAVMQGEMPRTK